MSSRQLQKAVRRAESRDRKRRPRMKVSGAGVKTLGRLVDRPKKRR